MPNVRLGSHGKSRKCQNIKFAERWFRVWHIIRFRLLGFGFRVRGFQVSVHAEVSKRLIRVSGLGFRTC